MVVEIEDLWEAPSSPTSNPLLSTIPLYRISFRTTKVKREEPCEEKDGKSARRNQRGQSKREKHAHLDEAATADFPSSLDEESSFLASDLPFDEAAPFEGPVGIDPGSLLMAPFRDDDPFDCWARALGPDGRGFSATTGFKSFGSVAGTAALTSAGLDEVEEEATDEEGATSERLGLTSSSALDFDDS